MPVASHGKHWACKGESKTGNLQGLCHTYFPDGLACSTVREYIIFFTGLSRQVVGLQQHSSAGVQHVYIPLPAGTLFSCIKVPDEA